MTTAALESSPAEPKESKKRQPQKLPKVLPKSEIEKLLATINTNTPTGCRNLAIMLTMYRAGLRVSEVCDLSPHDILFSDRLITVIDGKNHKDRNVYIDDRLLAALKAWNDIRPQSDYFFSTLEGGRLNRVYLNQVCERMSEKSGVYLHDKQKQKPIANHFFRHCFATELVEEGYPLHEIQKLMGHSNLQTTSVYLSVRDTQLSKKIQARK